MEGDRMTVYIYGLFDPRNLELRYIGKSENPELRFTSHLNDAKAGRDWYNPRKGRWFRQLLAQGLEPAMEVLEECTLENWAEIEKAWIKEAKEKGLRLINITEGGYSGSFKDRKHTRQTRQLMSQNMKGRRNPNKGKKMNLSPETRKKMSLRSTGKNNPMYGSNRTGDKNPMWGRGQSEESRKLIGERLRFTYSDPAKTPWYGKHLSSEHKEKIGKGKRGKKQSKEFIENLSIKMGGESNPMYGRKHSLEAKEKMKVSYALHVANRKGDIELVLELQEKYFRLYGRYHEKYPHKVDK